MPTYEYRCKSCGEHLEVVQKFTDDALTDCPACGAAGELRKVFGNIGITFKGSGFYKTDSRNGSTKTATTPDAGKQGDSSSTGDTKTETTSEPKTAVADSSGSTSTATSAA